MAESLSLTESGLDNPEDIIDAENQYSDSESEATRKRKIRSSTGSPSPHGEKPLQPKFNSNPIQLKSDFGVPPSVEKLALQGQVSNSPFLNKVPVTMDRNNRELPPKSTKPYRDYLDKNYIKETNQRCAASSFTLEKLTLDEKNDNFEGFTETFSMTLKRHLREESQIILLRNVVNDTFTNEMTTAHANSETIEGKKKGGHFHCNKE